MMKKFFYPDSIVIIGLSPKESNIPRLTLENLLRWGFKGKIFGVNPKVEDEHVNGVKMYKAVEELPEAPDLAYCMVSAKYIPGILEHCGKRGIKRVAIPSGGFSEYDREGEDLSKKTVKLAAKYGMRIVGPNSVTVANTKNGLCLPFVLLRKPPEGNTSIISQSGAVALTMLNFLQDENIGLAKFASIGNKLDLDEVDFLEYLGDDPATEVICLYLESLDRGREFIEIASKIDKPIIVYKSNTTEAGKKAAMSHTAAISNDEDIINSALERAGVIRIDNFMDFIEVTKAFQLPPMKGKRIMVMSPAGGFSVSAADMCEKAGFEFAELGEEFYQQLKEQNKANVINFSNPLDMGSIYDSNLMKDIFHSVMHSESVDGAVYMSQRPDMPEGESVFHDMFMTDFTKEIQGSILSSNKPFGVCLFGPSKQILDEKNIARYPIFNHPESMIRALSIQQKYHEKKSMQGQEELKSGEEYINFPGIKLDAAKAWLKNRDGDYGEEVLELLDYYKIPRVKSEVARDKEEAVQAAEELGYPVVMKLISPDALHKTDAGGVILDVARSSEVKENFDLIRENLENYDKDARFEGVRVQQMATGEGHEMFIGGKRDFSFGPVVYFGMGGVFVEVFKDVENVLCPAQKEFILERLKNLKAYEILKGIRGDNPADIGSFVELVTRVSLLLADFPEIQELDLNPVKVYTGSNGALALDGRVRICKNHETREIT